MPKNAEKYYCEYCDFSCSKKSNYITHISRPKHKIRTNTNEKMPKNAEIIHTCECGKKYKHVSSLWNHKQKCDHIDINTTDPISNDLVNMDNKDDFIVDKEFVMSVLKQNGELQTQMMETQTQMMELLKNGTHNTNNITNNKTFNLNFFLNETCKDAMNIMDFVNSLQLQLTDLEKMGDIGYVNGMSNIIIQNLKNLDVADRPIHCTDVKREVLYVKDDDKWDKEIDGTPKVRKAIKHIANKNVMLLREFKAKHPDCNQAVSKYSDTYNKLLVEAMGGREYETEEQEARIIKQVSKEVTVSK